MRKLIIGLVLLIGLLVAADFAAAAGAEYTVSEQMRRELSLTSDPSVRVNGFPFAAQALSGTYRDIDVTATGLDIGSFTDIGVEATLHGVRAPLADLRGGRLDGVRIDEVEGRVRVRDSDIGRAIGVADLRLEPASEEEVEEATGSTEAMEPDDDRAPVRMIATLNIAGEPTEVIAIGVIELVDGVLQFDAQRLRLAQDGVSAALPSLIATPLLARLSTEVDPGGLPFTVTPTAVQVETGSVVVTGTAEDVPLSQAGAGVG